MQSPASPATRAFAVHDYNLSFHEGSRHRLKRHGVQQLGPEILPLRLPGIDTPRWGQLATSRARPYQKASRRFQVLGMCSLTTRQCAPQSREYSKNQNLNLRCKWPTLPGHSEKGVTWARRFGAPCTGNGCWYAPRQRSINVMIPRGSALHQPDSWRLEMLKEEAKERGSTE